MVTLMSVPSFELSQDESCFMVEYLPKSKVYLASFEPLGTFCDVESSCDGQGHCVQALCETCASDMDCVLYSACIQGFYPDIDCEEFGLGREVLEMCE